MTLLSNKATLQTYLGIRTSAYLGRGAQADLWFSCVAKDDLVSLSSCICPSSTQDYRCVLPSLGIKYKGSYILKKHSAYCILLLVSKSQHSYTEAPILILQGEAILSLSALVTVQSEGKGSSLGWSGKIKGTQWGRESRSPVALSPQLLIYIQGDHLASRFSWILWAAPQCQPSPMSQRSTSWTHFFPSSHMTPISPPWYP